MQLLSAALFISAAVATATTAVPHVVHEFPLGTWVENLAVRSTHPSDILATILSAPEVYLVKTTPSPPAPAPELLVSFPDALGVLGIAELGRDKFYVVVGNWSTVTFASTPGSYAIYEVDLNKFKPAATTPPASGPYTAPGVHTRLVATVPGGGFLNGVTVLDPSAGTILVADSLFGLVWHVNTVSGAVALALNDTSMTPNAGSVFPGVNGIHIYSPGSAPTVELFYSNSAKGSFSRVNISTSTGEAVGPFETVLTSSAIGPDDFALDHATDSAWVASDPDNQVDRIRYISGPLGNATLDIVFGQLNSTTLAGLTSAAFGLSAPDLASKRLYFTTTGGIPQYAGQNWTFGGTVGYVDVAPLH